MQKIYDILLNYKKNPYEFYEWNKTDNIDHIKSILCFKIKDDSLYDLINNDAKIDVNFLKIIKDKTELFGGKLVKNIEYACIFYSREVACAFEFYKYGRIKNRSYLLFDEEEDIILSGKLDKIVDIKYEIIKKYDYNDCITRNEAKKISQVTKYMDNIKSKDEIKYIYFECFNEEEKDSSIAIKKLKEKIKNLDNNIIDKLTKVINIKK